MDRSNLSGLSPPDGLLPSIYLLLFIFFMPGFLRLLCGNHPPLLPKHFSHLFQNLFQKVKLALAFFPKSCIINLIEPTTPLVFHAQPGGTFYL